MTERSRSRNLTNLIRLDAAGCLLGAVAFAFTEAWAVSVLLGAVAVTAALFTRLPDRRHVLATEVLACGNVAWAVGVTAVLVAGGADGIVAALLAVTVGWTLLLATLQARAVAHARRGLVASAA